MKTQDNKFITAIRKGIQMDKNKHYDSMTHGEKKPDENARKWFKRPAYLVKKDEK